MPYLQVELDAKKAMAKVAKACGLPVGEVCWGLLELWEHCYSAKLNVVSDVVLDGCLGTGEKLREALVAFGFLEPADGGYRIRGASRYLHVSELQSARGKARAAGAKRDARGRLQPAGPEITAPPDLTTRTPAELQPAAGDDSSRTPASPNTKHQTPIKEEAAAAARAKEAPPAPRPPADRFADAHSYFAWLQLERIESGFVTEKPPPPRELSAWWSEMLLEFGGDHELVDATVARWAVDPYWRKENLPFRGLMKQWRKYAPRREAAAS